MDTLRLLVLFALLQIASVAPAAGETFVVNTTADAGDFDLKDGVADSDASAAGQQITLRCAIENANLTPEADEIRFDLSAADPGHRYYKNDEKDDSVGIASFAATTAEDDGAIDGIDPDHPHSWWTIAPRSALPDITAPLSIDGYAQRGAQPATSHEGIRPVLRVEIDGSQASAAAVMSLMQGGDPEVAGICIRADDCTIRGLAITRFGNNRSPGVLLAANRAVVAGCYLGVDPSGLRAKPNFCGVQISRPIDRFFEVTNNRIGSDGDGNDDLAERNLISGNYAAGVLIAGEVVGSVVAGNYIGADRTGSGRLPNGHGVQIRGLASGNRIGGVKPGEANVIAFNNKDGVQIAGGETSFGVNNAILSNRIHSNAAIGINLALPPETTNDVTPNDRGDVDEGPNHLQNFPELTSATTTTFFSIFKSTGQTKVKGALKSNPNTNYRVEFFINGVGDRSGHGEGMTYAGFVNVNTGETLIADFEIALRARAFNRYAISATATQVREDGAFGSTSEFSANVLVVDRFPAWLWLIVLGVVVIAIGWLVIVKRRRATEPARVAPGRTGTTRL